MKSIYPIVTIVFLLAVQEGCVPVKYTNTNNTYFASVAEGQGKLDSAIYYYSQAIKTESRNGNLYQKRALVYSKMGKQVEATADINQAIDISKRNWEFYYSRGLILERQSLYNQAINDYTTYIEKADKKLPDYYMGYWGRGKCYNYTNAYAQAAEDFSQSIRIKPSDANLYSWRASCYYTLGKFAEAAADYESFLQPNPKSYRELFYLGSAYTLGNEKEKAAGVLKRLAEIDPTIPSYFSGDQQLDFFNLELRRKKVRAALEEVAVNLESLSTTGSKSLADISLNTAFEKLQLAWGYATSIDKESKLLLDSVITGFYSVYPKLKVKPPIPENVRKCTVQATSYVDEKNYNPAIELYQRALTIAPYYPLARFNLAMLYATMRDFRSAIAQMMSYMKLAPDAPDARAAQDKIYEWELKVKN